MSTIVNAFARAGIYPVKGDMIKKGGTLHPAKLHHESSDSSQAPMGTYMYVWIRHIRKVRLCHTSCILKAIEAIVEPATVKKYNEQYSEGYDVPGDELYNVWIQLKKTFHQSTQLLRNWSAQ